MSSRPSSRARRGRSIPHGRRSRRCSSMPWRTSSCGDGGAVGASLERALELAEPEGIVLPFALVHVRELLERHRGRRTAHAALLTTIFDMLAGSAPVSAAPTLLDPLSDAELRVLRYLPSNLKSTEIASELFVSSEHRPNPSAPHLRQARRPQPHRGRGPRAPTRPTGPRLPPGLTAAAVARLRRQPRARARKAAAHPRRGGCRRPSMRATARPTWTAGRQ